MKKQKKAKFSTHLVAAQITLIMRLHLWVAYSDVLLGNNILVFNEYLKNFFVSNVHLKEYFVYI